MEDICRQNVRLQDANEMAESEIDMFVERLARANHANQTLAELIHTLMEQIERRDAATKRLWQRTGSNPRIMEELGREENGRILTIRSLTRMVNTEFQTINENNVDIELRHNTDTESDE